MLKHVKHVKYDTFAGRRVSSSLERCFYCAKLLLPVHATRQNFAVFTLGVWAMSVVCACWVFVSLNYESGAARSSAWGTESVSLYTTPKFRHKAVNVGARYTATSIAAWVIISTRQQQQAREAQQQHNELSKWSCVTFVCHCAMLGLGFGILASCVLCCVQNAAALQLRLSGLFVLF